MVFGRYAFDGASEELAAAKCSLVAEDFALHHGVQQRADAVFGCGGVGEDALDGGAVGEGDGRAGRIYDELAGEVARDLSFVGEEQLLEFVAVGAMFLDKSAHRLFLPKINSARKQAPKARQKLQIG